MNKTGNIHPTPMATGQPCLVVVPINVIEITRPFFILVNQNKTECTCITATPALKQTSAGQTELKE